MVKPLNLTLKQKLFLLQCLALVPWLVGVGYVIYYSWPEIRNMNREIEATRLLPHYFALVKAVQVHRGLSFIYLNLSHDSAFGRKIGHQIRQTEALFYKQLKKLKFLMRKEISNRKKLIKVASQFQKLRLDAYRGDPEENFWRHTFLINQLIAMMEMEGESHGLFADPDLYVRTLAQVALIELPKLTEILGRIRGVGSGFLANHDLGRGDKRELLRLYSQAYAYSGALKWTLANIRFPTKTILLLKSGSQELQDFLKRSEDIVAGSQVSFTPMGYFHIASEVIGKFVDIYLQLMDEVGVRLKDKRRRFIRNWLIFTFILSTIFICLCLSFYVAYKSVADKLSIVREGVRRIAEGDFSTRIPLESEDEIGQLVKVLNSSLARLQENIKEIYTLYYYDRLTRLPNRAKFFQDLAGHEAPALILLDINNFKDVNFVFGEECGDEILKELAQRMRSIFSLDSYRIGPDEFVVLADLASWGSDFDGFFKEVERGIRTLEARPFRWLDENEIFISFYAAVVSECVHPEKILIYAYDALKEAKAAGNKLVKVTSPVEKQRPLYRERMIWAQKTRRALDEGRIIPFYQPIFNLSTGKIEKFEALVRLVEEDGTVVPPIKFLEISQKIGLYPEITKAVVRQVLEDFASLPYEVSINLALMDFESPEIRDYITTRLDHFCSLDPRGAERLVFEVVETDQIGNYEMVKGFLELLKERGCKIAVDDFGSAYSNLERIIELQVDYLKIDASLVKKLPHDPTVRVLVEAIVQFAQRVGIGTIAEFVADETIFKLVKEMGVTYAQGYFIAPPQPIEAIRAKYL